MFPEPLPPGAADTGMAWILLAALSPLALAGGRYQAQACSIGPSRQRGQGDSLASAMLSWAAQQDLRIEACIAGAERRGQLTSGTWAISARWSEPAGLGWEVTTDTLGVPTWSECLGHVFATSKLPRQLHGPSSAAELHLTFIHL